LFGEVGATRSRLVEKVIIADEGFESGEASNCSDEVFRRCRYYLILLIFILRELPNDGRRA
jgi:NADH:ubiquinone oxidoreductase subunit 3 (subunit A)